MREIATEAAEELAALIGHEAEGVSAVRRGEAGWRVEVDVVE
ncbi:gas vesicle protein, partial [Streptomyces sp. SID11233]|nr:gas vesicle protein [Streptomyces sp. SID11233]